MTECINVYRATQPIARSLLSSGVRLYRNGQSYYQTFSSPGGPIILVFRKGTRLWNSDGVTLNRGAKQRWGTKNLRFSTSILEIPIPIPIPNIEVFQNTETEYRTDTKIPNTDSDSKYRHRPSSSAELYGSRSTVVRRRYHLCNAAPTGNETRDRRPIGLVSSCPFQFSISRRLQHAPWIACTSTDIAAAVVVSDINKLPLTVSRQR